MTENDVKDHLILSLKGVQYVWQRIPNIFIYCFSPKENLQKNTINLENIQINVKHSLNDNWFANNPFFWFLINYVLVFLWFIKHFIFSLKKYKKNKQSFEYLFIFYKTLNNTGFQNNKNSISRQSIVFSCIFIFSFLLFLVMFFVSRVVLLLLNCSLIHICHYWIIMTIVVCLFVCYCCCWYYYW